MIPPFFEPPKGVTGKRFFYSAEKSVAYLFARADETFFLGKGAGGLPG
jgi:hypothetical protein